MGALFVLLCTLVTVVACGAACRHLWLRRKYAGIPGARSLPLIGHGLIIRPDPTGFFDQVR